MAQATTLDDKIQRRQHRLRPQVFDRFLKRHDERLADGARAAQAEARLHRRRDRSSTTPSKIDYPADDDGGQRAAGGSGSSSTCSSSRSTRPTRTRRSSSSRSATRPQPDVPPVRHDRPARGLPHQPDPDLRPALVATWAPSTLEDMINQQLHLSLEGIGASLSVRGRLRGRQGGRPRHGAPTRTAGSSPRTRSSASRRRTARRSTSSRRSSATSSATSAARAAPRSG